MFLMMETYVQLDSLIILYCYICITRHPGTPSCYLFRPVVQKACKAQNIKQQNCMILICINVRVQ